jgi:hypothetical protein
MKEKLHAILHYVSEAKTSLKEIDAFNAFDRSATKDTVLYYLNNAITDIEAAIKEDEEEPTERFEVRKKLVQILGLPSTKDECHRFEEAFDWVMDGKKVDRDGKLFCLEYARKHESPNSASVLEKAKSIFNVLL